MVASHSCAGVPKITINIGGCFADDNFAMVYWISNVCYLSWFKTAEKENLNKKEMGFLFYFCSPWEAKTILAIILQKILHIN